MEELVLHVRMLGELSLECLGVSVSHSRSRSYKVWPMLAYLLYHHRRMIPQSELIRLMGGAERNVNPGGALRTSLWRVRRALEPISERAGMELIVSGDGAYGWNPALRLELDAEQMEALCREGLSGESGALEPLLRAAALYQGNFLERISEDWVEPIATYYREMYIAAVTEALPLLVAASRAPEAVALGKAALPFSPYDEPLHRQLMRGMMAAGDHDGAGEAYERLRDLLFRDLGVMPSEETRAIYREILRGEGSRTYSLDAIQAQLTESHPASGAMICDYATFKLFYQAEARSAARRGDAIHIGVLTVAGRNGQILTEKGLSRAMEQLDQEIQHCLRTGDLASACSASQYLLLLIQANAENSEMVCRRVMRAFALDHPHSAAEIRVSVMPLEPANASGGRPPAT